MCRLCIQVEGDFSRGEHRAVIMVVMSIRTPEDQRG